MKNRVLPPLAALALGIAIAGYAAPASATIVYVTVTGTVSSGTDGSGFFGTVGANLTGDAYIAQYKFDTSLGYTVSATQNSAQGGAYYAGNGAPYTTSPSLGASLTINGHSVSIAGTYNSEILGYRNGSFSESYVQANDLSSGLYNDMTGYPGTSPGSITTAFTIYAADNYSTVGGFNGGSTHLNLLTAVYTESLSDPAAVPEPASMALLGVGLLGTAVMARRRRQSGTAPIAG